MNNLKQVWVFKELIFSAYQKTTLPYGLFKKWKQAIDYCFYFLFSGKLEAAASVKSFTCNRSFI